jgi:hypothetical protein
MFTAWPPEAHAGPPSANLVVSESPLRKLARDAASACYNFIEPAVSYVHKALDSTGNTICTMFRKNIRVFRGWNQCSLENVTELAVADNLTASFHPCCDLNDSHRRNYRLATEEFHMPRSHFDHVDLDKLRFLPDILADMTSEALKKVMLLVIEQFARLRQMQSWSVLEAWNGWVMS